MTLFSIFILSLISTTVSFANAQTKMNQQTTTCTAYIQAINHYDELENGKLVNKFSIFDLTEWSSSSSFEAILATEKTAEGSIVKLSFSDKVGAKPKAQTQGTVGKPFGKDKKYKEIDLKIATVLNKEIQSGVYTIEVLDKNKKSLCKESFAVTYAD